MNVITHQFLNGTHKAEIDLCEMHTKKFNPATYYGVKEGLHEGNCEYCEQLKTDSGYES